MFCANLRLKFLASGAVFGDPNGTSRQRVILPGVRQAQVLDSERKCDSAEKLALALLLQLFTTEELGRGNCTKPVRKDVYQLDTERLWAIKCRMCLPMHACPFYSPYTCTSAGHIDFIFPISDADLGEMEKDKALNKRWTTILQKCLNPKCRQLRIKQE